MNKIIKFIRKIEKKAYPRYMRQMGQCKSMEDIAEYAECSVEDLLVLTGEHWYALFALHGQACEAVDLAKIPGSPKIDWGYLVDELRKRGIRRVELDAREKTSYKLLKRYAGQLGIEITEGSSWEWGNETMHSLVLAL